MDNPATDCGAIFESAVFLSYFNDMPDPPQAVKVVYPLDEVLLLSRNCSPHRCHRLPGSFG